MDNEVGYIKLSRKFFTTMWKEARAFSSCEAWLDLIQSARFDATHSKRISIGGREVSYGRGQVVASIRYLSKRWGQGERWVRVALSKFVRDGRITIDSSQGVNVITLVNYEKYNVAYDTAKDTVEDTSKDLKIKELEVLVAQLRTQLRTQQSLGHTRDTKKNKDNNIKETSTKVDAKKGDLSLALSKRKEIFRSTLTPYISQYGEEMISEFLEYWTEPNKSQTKMRFELEKTWGLSRRLSTWNRNKSQYGKKSVEAEIANDVPWDRVIENFNTLGIVKLLLFDDERKRAFSFILKTYGKDAISEVYKKIRHSDRLKGHNDRRWVADFDFVFTPKNFRKIREGVFDDNII